jgi:hypothetical protein
METRKTLLQLETSDSPNFLFMEILRAPWFMELDLIINRLEILLLTTEANPLEAAMKGTRGRPAWGKQNIQYPCQEGGEIYTRKGQITTPIV